MREFQGRHELKHYINYADVLQLRSRLPFVASLDKHATEGNGYRVKSLYFDNYNDKALKEKIDGVNEREKFRLRFYNDDTSFIRLEKKSKENGNHLFQELYAKMHYQQLRAKNIVDYQREAFIYPMGNVRVTLDYDIRTSNNVFDFLKPQPVPVPISGVYILEVKYDSFLPEIIRGMVSLSSRRSTAFSKYAVTRII